MKVGDIVETAIWVTGNEEPAMREQFKKDVESALIEGNQAQGVTTGPIVWTEKLPGTPRVPPVPGHISGPCVRLLVAEAEVLEIAPEPGAFLAELEPRDLALLRRHTRAAYAQARARDPKRWREPRLTDAQCDTIINDIGPEAALLALRRGEVTIQ